MNHNPGEEHNPINFDRHGWPYFFNENKKEYTKPVQKDQPNDAQGCGALFIFAMAIIIVIYLLAG